MTRAAYARLLPTLLLALLALDLWISQLRLPETPPFQRLPEPPRIPMAPLLGLGDGEAGGRFLTLWLQGFDTQAAAELRLADLDYRKLSRWLLRADLAMRHSAYPIFLAAMIYGGIQDPAMSRAMFELVRRMFRRDPENRWYWMAMATSLAWRSSKKGNRELPLAMAADLYALAPPSAPNWARFLQLYLLRNARKEEQARTLAQRALREKRFDRKEDRLALRAFLHRLQIRTEDQRP